MVDAGILFFSSFKFLRKVQVEIDTKVTSAMVLITTKLFQIIKVYSLISQVKTFNNINYDEIQCTLQFLYPRSLMQRKYS